MTPIETLARAAAAGRRILLWGAGNQGRGIARVLQRHRIPVSGFIDSATALRGATIEGIPVLSPEILQEEGAPQNLFVVVAAFFFAEPFAQRLEESGFKKGLSYMPFREVKPRDYAVEISGVCNLHCLSCPRADRTSGLERPRKLMSLETFKAVIDKLHQEEPFVGNIQLYQWGEPTLNRDLPAMLAYARHQEILCAISSNLNHAADFEAIIAARPEWLRLSASGTGESYEVTHTGGRWETFRAHLRRVAELRRRHHPQMKVELYYHRYRHSTPEQQAEVEALCASFDFEIHPIPAYLIGLDDVLAWCEGRNLPPAAATARTLLLRDLSEGVALAQAEKALPCEVWDSILINADLSVSTCMMYYYPEQNTAVSNYLEAPLEQIIAARRHAPLCGRCMAQGIHRYCGVYARISDEERPR